MCLSLYIPKLSTNLMFVSKITNSGHIVVFEYDWCIVVDKKSKIFALGKRHGNLYKMSHCYFGTNQAPSSTLLVNKTLLWLYRLSHLNHASVANMSRQYLVLDIDYPKDKIDLLVCESCIIENQARLPFRSSHMYDAKDVLLHDLYSWIF